MMGVDPAVVCKQTLKVLLKKLLSLRGIRTHYLLDTVPAP